MNRHLQHTHPYPFERLRALLAGASAPPGIAPISWSIGEPRHAPPAFVVDALTDPGLLAADLSAYPATRGSDALRAAIAAWATRRFDLPADLLDPDVHVLPVNGTREALFAIAQAVVDPGAGAVVGLPNPFYQIYEGAALLAGAEPRYLPCTPATGELPDLDGMSARDWQRCALLYLCSPGNPTGAIMDVAALQRVIELADRYNFVIAADECYSEIYHDEATPPAGLLQAAAAMGRTSLERCLVFHSLSKRSNLPGLRSGFVAGDAHLIERFLHYRTYHGCAMPQATQRASVLAWNDEQHVVANRALYRAKFDAVVPVLRPVLDVTRPPAGFYLWPEITGDDETFTRQLLMQTGITVLPGSYLGRADPGNGRANPGAGHVRMALVAPLDNCVEAAQRLADMVQAS